MNEHLQVLVVTHVVGGVLIYASCVAERQVVHAQYHSLFVLCNQLRLTRVGLTADTRRQPFSSMFTFCTSISAAPDGELSL